jgi:hypothetical protein
METMRHSAVVLAALPSLTLLLFASTGCGGQTSHYQAPTACESSEPYHLGEAQALRGQPIDYAGRAQCYGQADGNAFTASLEAGYRAGQQRFCAPERARAIGMEHGSKNQAPSFDPRQFGICADLSPLQAAYREGHAAGLDEFCQAGLFEQVGHKFGSEGDPFPFVPAMFVLCGQPRVQAMGEAYARGHQRGVASFCTPARWEDVGRTAGNEGKLPADVGGSLAVCQAEQRPLIAAHYERGYQSGLASYCEPARWEPWGHGLGTEGRRAPPGLGNEIAVCSPTHQSAIAMHVRRGYETGLRTYCDNSGIVAAARAAAREGSEPILPKRYAVCLDVFPETQMIFASGYQAQLNWMQQQWGSSPPMLPVKFQELVQYARTQNTRAERLLVLKGAAQYSHFTAQQVRLLMLELEYENDRVELAATLYPVVVDRIHWDQVYDTLYHHGQAALRERVAALP